MKNLISTTFISFLVFSFLPAQAKEDPRFSVETLYNGSDVLWGFDFLNDQEVILTKRGGSMKHLNLADGKVQTLSGVPEVRTQNQGGLLDVLVREIGDNTYIYWTYSKPEGRRESTVALMRSQWRGGALQSPEELFVAKASSREGRHFGSRLVFDREGYLFMTVGDRGVRDEAQNKSNHIGTILRLNADGTVAQGNPFASTEGALPEIWSYGHRNPQGIDIHPTTGELWSGEFGPRGGDEINLIRPGLNYGWPVVTFGREYWGPKIGVGTEKEGMEPPVVEFTPSLSYSGIAFYRGEAFPEWQNHLLLACLRTTHLHRLELNDQNEVVSSEKLLEGLGERLRMVRVGPDENIYVSTDSGKLLRLSPKTKESEVATL